MKGLQLFGNNFDRHFSHRIFTTFWFKFKQTSNLFHPKKLSSIFLNSSRFTRRRNNKLLYQKCLCCNYRYVLLVLVKRSVLCNHLYRFHLKRSGPLAISLKRDYYARFFLDSSCEIVLKTSIVRTKLTNRYRTTTTC